MSDNDRASWETPVWSPLLSDAPSDHLERYRNPALHRAQVALVCLDPSDPDVATSRADLRSAIGIARGRDLDDICPSTGYDLSDSAFATARDGWREHLARESRTGPSEWTLAEHARARAFWATARPDLIQDWPEEGPR